jgi:hypothetical protein
MRMPFGMHRGEQLADLPEEYLTWLLTLSNLSPALRRAIEGQLDVQERERLATIRGPRAAGAGAAVA